MDQQKVVTFEGKTHRFPADFTDEEIAAALGEKRLPIASGEASVPGRTTGADIGIGAAKGAARTALNLGSLAGKINPVDAIANLVLPESMSRHLPGNRLDQMRSEHGAIFEPEGGTQEASALATELLAGAIPGGAAARGSNALRNLAANAWQKAARRPVLESPAVARGVLDQGLGRLTRSNAREYVARNPSMTPAALQSVERSVAGAEANAANPGRSVIGTVLSPGNRAAAAQGLYNAAPTLNVAGGGAAGGFANLLLSLLGGR